MLRELKDNGLVRLEVSYSGGGDDGCIDTYSGYELDEKGVEKWSQDSVPGNFEQEFDDYLYTFISDNIEWDWINNDGGYGTITIDLETGKMTIDHSQRHIEDYHYDDIESELEKSLNGSS